MSQEFDYPSKGNTAEEIVEIIHTHNPELTGDSIVLIMKGDMNKFSRNGTVLGLILAGFGAKFVPRVAGHYMPMIYVTKYPLDSNLPNEIIEISWGDY